MTMRLKWIKRSDRILLAMIVLWFIGAAWGMSIITAQLVCQIIIEFRTPPSSIGYYGSPTIGVDLTSVLVYIGGPVTGGLVTWLIKNMSEANTKSKLNPDYLKNHLPEDDLDKP